uniref:thermonuclease family protein n=1 Tax=Hylemonella sp. TaxID=2066020 RepID=UPI0035B077BF
MRNIVCVAILGLAIWCQAEVITGRVVSVTDGDTVTVLDAAKVQHKVRLAGIDAPEKSQAFGQRSRESLVELVAGKTVIVETYKKDRYGRSIGKVLVNGRDMNFEQIRRGLAWFYRQYEVELSPDDRQIYDRAESEAKDYKKGLWSDRNPVPPWEFRRRAGAR